MSRWTRRPPGLHLVGMGAQAAVGLEPRAIAAAVRGGLNRFQATDWLRDKANGEPIVTSLLSFLDPRLSARERMHRLGIEAATQALAPLLASGQWAPGTPVPMILSVPPVRPGMKDGGLQLARDLMTGLPVPPDKGKSGVMDTGHDGGLAALAYAEDLLTKRRADVCLVGGVDSLRDLELLDWLQGLGRLKGAEAPAGLIPGEGAAFLLVCSEAWLRRAKLQRLGMVTRPAYALEPNPWYMARPCLGEGLTEAMRGALDLGLPADGRAGVVWCDLNGEHWRADEWSYAYVRTVKRHGEPLQIRHPADCLGDLGAATGPMLVMLAALDLGHPRTQVGSALVFTASDTRPHRSACVVLKEGGG